MSSIKKKVILVVEDEAPLRTALHQKFTDEGFRVVDAVDGEEGLEKALEIHPDIILLDIIMPNMDGLTMAKRLKADPWGEHAEIIILSNLADSQKLAEMFEAGVQDYLIKTDWKIEDVVTMVRTKLSDAKDE